MHQRSDIGCALTFLKGGCQPLRPADGRSVEHSPSPRAVARAQPGKEHLPATGRPLKDNPASGHDPAKSRPRTIRLREHPNSETTSVIDGHAAGIGGSSFEPRRGIIVAWRRGESTGSRQGQLPSHLSVGPGKASTGARSGRPRWHVAATTSAQNQDGVARFVADRRATTSTAPLAWRRTLVTVTLGGRSTIVASGSRENVENPKVDGSGSSSSRLERELGLEPQRELGRTVMPVDHRRPAAHRRPRRREVVLVADGGAVLPRRTSLVGNTTGSSVPLPVSPRRTSTSSLAAT